MMEKDTIKLASGEVVERSWEAGNLPTSTRNTKPVVQDDPNIEAQFKQEVNNPSVREHDPAIYEQQALTDSIIEDTTEQLNAVQQERDLLKSDLELAKQALDEKRIENLQLKNKIWELAERCVRLRVIRNRQAKIAMEIVIENCKLKNRFWYRVGQWLKYQWNYDIYNPPR